MGREKVHLTSTYILTLPLMSSVTLGILLNLSEFVISLEKWDSL